MKALLKTLFLMIVVGLVIAGVASIMSKKRLESKSDDEIREFLARKLDGKVGEEQLTTIQDAVIGGIRGKSSRTEADPSDDDDDDDESAPADTAGDPADEADDDADNEGDDVASEDDDADESSKEVSAE
jgi:hypothetical protein